MSVSTNSPRKNNRSAARAALKQLVLGAMLAALSVVIGMFCKSFLNFGVLYGKRLLTLRLCVEVDSFCILATCEGGILVNRSELGTLFRDARNAGFEIERFPDGFRLSAPLLPRRDFALHAISEGITLLVAKLRKIFFD